MDVSTIGFGILNYNPATLAAKFILNSFDNYATIDRDLRVAMLSLLIFNAVLSAIRKPALMMNLFGVSNYPPIKAAIIMAIFSHLAVVFAIGSLMTILKPFFPRENIW